MTYEIDEIILATHYNGFTGASGTAAYASQVAVDAAAPAVGAVYGVGYGDRGYGQTGFTLAAVSVGQDIDSDEWTDMRNALDVCSEHQNGIASGLIPPVNELEPTDVIQAHESSGPTFNAFDFDSVIADIETNRFVVDSAKDGTFVTTGASSTTRGSSWGSGSGSINCIFDFGFGSEDAARFFFNSGGQIRIDMTHPAGTPQDNDWRSSLITRLGQVQMTHTATSSTGSSSLTSGIGYYDLTDAYQTIIDGTNIGTGAYTSNDVLIEAHRLSQSGVNGGNGVGVRVRITLTDQHANAFFDTVSSGTNASFSVLKATFLVGIVTPSGTITDPF